MEKLLDYGPEALLELHAQEKQLVERMRHELNQLQHEVTELERNHEINEEGELNEINKRLLKLRFDTEILKAKERYETKAMDTILSTNLDTILKEREKLNKIQIHIMETENHQQDNELKQLNELLSSCQEQMTSNSFDDAAINQTMDTLLESLKQFDDFLTQEANSIDQKSNQIHKENNDLQKQIDEITQNISFMRRKTMAHTDISREIINPALARRHSMFSPFSLRTKKHHQQK